MKIQSINIYLHSSKNKTNLSFGKIDNKENNIEEVIANEERKLFNEYCQKSDALSRKYECGDFSWNGYLLERESLDKWFYKQKDLIKEKYHNIAQKLPSQNTIAKKVLKK